MIFRSTLCLLVLVLAPPTPPLAQACAQDRLDLPEPVADAVRPYVVCGLFTRGQTDLSSDGHAIDASIYGPNSTSACAIVRAKAVLEADRHLQSTIPDREGRERFIAAALQEADRFIAALPSSHTVGIDPTVQPVPCRAHQTRTPNAQDQ